MEHCSQAHCHEETCQLETSSILLQKVINVAKDIVSDDTEVSKNIVYDIVYGDRALVSCNIVCTSYTRF